MATDVSAPFPDLDLEEQSIVTVELGNPASQITRIVVHFTQDVPQVPVKFDVIPPPLVHIPIREGEAPGFGPGG